MAGSRIRCLSFLITGWRGCSLQEQSRILSQLVEGAYVRVLGSIRSFEGRRILKTFKAFGLTDLNELTMHLAEVVHSHMALTVGETVSSLSLLLSGWASTATN